MMTQENLNHIAAELKTNEAEISRIHREDIRKLENRNSELKETINNALKQAVSDYLRIFGPVTAARQWGGHFTLQDWKNEDVDYEIQKVYIRTFDRKTPYIETDNWQICVCCTGSDERFGNSYALTIKLSEALAPERKENIAKASKEEKESEIRQKRAQLAKLQAEVEGVQ